MDMQKAYWYSRDLTVRELKFNVDILAAFVLCLSDLEDREDRDDGNPYGCFCEVAPRTDASTKSKDIVEIIVV